MINQGAVGGDGREVADESRWSPCDLWQDVGCRRKGIGDKKVGGYHASSYHIKRRGGALQSTSY
jgi:hypothetical protein